MDNNRHSNSWLESLITVTFWALLIFFIIVMCLYFGRFWGVFSNNPNEWGSFGSLVGGVGILLFSVANLKIWLHQSKENSRALIGQVRFKEQLLVYNDLRSKLIYATTVPYTLEEYKKINIDAKQCLKQWDWEFYKELFKDKDQDIINEALNSLDELEKIWIEHDENSTVLGGRRLVILDDEAFLKAIDEQAKVLSILLEYYRKQLQED